VEILFSVVLILAAFYVGWNIGANDAANCIGTTVGAQIISYRKAVLIMSCFVILGGVLQGHHVMKTVGKGIVMNACRIRPSWWRFYPPVFSSPLLLFRAFRFQLPRLSSAAWPGWGLESSE
jgi:phosphate/sulfate permease